MRRLRIIIGITILILSVALLIWALLPQPRETRTQPISPTELQLPTPSSFHFEAASLLSASLPQLNPVF